MKYLKTISPLMWRAIVFLGLFVGISGVLGPRIIASDHFFSGGFGIYGSVGKAVLFSAVAFGLLLMHRKKQPKLQAWKKPLLLWGAGSVLALVGAWVGVDRMVAGDADLRTFVGIHACLLLSLAFAFMACFGIADTVRVWKFYKRELLYAAACGVVFLVFLTVVYAAWPWLAGIALSGVVFLLDIAGPESMVLPPQTLLFDKFGITIAEFCSGIESIALFTALYAVVGLLDWQRMRKRRFILVFPVALVALCAVNILRIYGLILAGYYIDPAIAFSLFHTYAGMVFFIIYSAIFWAVAYKHLVIPQSKPQEKPKHGRKKQPKP